MGHYLMHLVVALPFRQWHNRLAPQHALHTSTNSDLFSVLLVQADVHMSRKGLHQQLAFHQTL